MTATISDKGFPRPYRREGQSIKAITHGTWFSIARVDTKKFTVQGREDQADFIVHACNSYDDLLAALVELLDQLDGIGIPDWHGAEGLSLEQAKAAIAKAVQS